MGPSRSCSQFAMDQNIVVVVPRLAVAVVDLHHAHAFLHQAPRHQAAASEIADRRNARARSSGSLVISKTSGASRLHAECDLRRLDARSPVAGRSPSRFIFDPVQLRAADPAARRCSVRRQIWIADVLDQLVGRLLVVRNVRALIDRGQERRTPQLRAHDRTARGTARRSPADSDSPCRARTSATSPWKGVPDSLSPQFMQEQRRLVIRPSRCTSSESRTGRRCASPSLGKISLISMPLLPVAPEV